MNVNGAMMVEPTETESKAEMDTFIAAIREIVANAPKHTHGAQQTFVTHIDETAAARTPRLNWNS